MSSSAGLSSGSGRGRGNGNGNSGNNSNGNASAVSGPKENVVINLITQKMMVISNDSTISKLKDQILEKWAIPKDEQTLLARSNLIRPLSDNHVIAENLHLVYGPISVLISLENAFEYLHVYQHEKIGDIMKKYGKQFGTTISGLVLNGEELDANCSLQDYTTKRMIHLTAIPYVVPVNSAHNSSDEVAKDGFDSDENDVKKLHGAHRNIKKRESLLISTLRRAIFNQ